MAISSDICATAFFGNGSTATPYPVNWFFIEPAHIKVRVRDASLDPPGPWQELSQPADYTVHLWNDEVNLLDWNPRVITDAAWSEDYQVVVYRQTPVLQPIVFPISGPFPAKANELGHDRAILILQEFIRDWLASGLDMALFVGPPGVAGEDGEDGATGLSADNSLHWVHEAPVNKTYPVVLHSNKGGVITGVVTKTSSGTLTANFRLNGTTIGGLGAVAVTSTKDTVATDPVEGVAFDVGDTIDVVISSASVPQDFAFSLLA